MKGYKEDLVDLLLESEALQFGDFVDDAGRSTPFSLDLDKLSDDYGERMEEIVVRFIKEEGVSPGNHLVMLVDLHRRSRDEPTLTELQDLEEKLGKKAYAVMEMSEIVDHMLTYGTLDPEVLTDLRNYYRECGPEGEEEPYLC